jgi:predicted metal-binding membrane protein
MNQRMSKIADRDFSHLSLAPAWLGAGFARPRLIAISCVVVLTTLGWLALALMVVHMSAPLGPDDGSLGLLPRMVAVLCQPRLGPAVAESVAFDLAVAGTMWAAMVLAMMLPSAAPMIMTYADIAETASRKRERIVTPLVIAAGYGVVWVGFAAAAAVMQLVLARLALLESDLASASSLLSGAIFIGAGLYQFSALKHACLRACRAPFPFLFAHWQTSARGVFRLGVQQGLFCLGCCWAMMLVMFAVGVMNVVWMAGLGVVMTLEKMAGGSRLPVAIGVAAIAIGFAFVLAAVAAHWPAQLI